MGFFVYNILLDSGYKNTHRIVREKNKIMVFMDGWSIEEKKDFFINAIP